MKFKENAIKKDMIIHCPTEEDAEALLKYLKELGYVWCSGEEIDSNSTRYEKYKENTCYDIGYCGNKKIAFCELSGESERGSSITEFSDLLEPEMRFKVGDKVRVRNDLIGGNFYGEYKASCDMEIYRGKIITICKISKYHYYKVCENAYTWTDEMLEPVETSTDLPESKQPEMTAAEIVDWLAKNYYNEKIMAKAFGDDSCLDELGEKLGAQGIIDKITAYEAAKKAPKPVETEWVDICRIIKVKADGTKKCVYEEDDIPNEMFLGVLDACADILKKYISEHDGEYIATVESVCRVKA